MRRGRRRRLAGLIVALALAGVGCGGTGVDTIDETPDRPPLGSPPDPGPVPTDDGLDPPLRDRVIRSTVGIKGVSCGRLSTGSGFAIADDVVATNAHVILGVEEIRVITTDGRELLGEPRAYDPVADLAILEIPGLGLEPLPLGDAADGTVGALIGWEEEPEATPYRIDRPITVRIEAVGREERVERPSWLVAAEIDKGDSGGALVDARGVVVGIAYATSRVGDRVGYAVRAEVLEDLLAEGFDRNLIVPGC